MVQPPLVATAFEHPDVERVANEIGGWTIEMVGDQHDQFFEPSEDWHVHEPDLSRDIRCFPARGRWCVVLWPVEFVDHVIPVSMASARGAEAPAVVGVALDPATWTFTILDEDGVIRDRQVAANADLWEQRGIVLPDATDVPARVFRLAHGSPWHELPRLPP